MIPGTGFAWDDPAASASQTSDRHWPFSLLVSGEDPLPSRYLDPNLRPNALNQDGIGACVAFAACTIWDAMEHKDWGRHLFATGTFGTPDSGNPTGAYLAYRNLKRGFGSYPGDGLPTVEGSYPEQVWKLAKAEGLPDKDGKRHKAAAYYAQKLTDAASLDVVRRTIMATGPVNIATPWPSNWFAAPTGPRYILPAPLAIAYGHSYTCVGWETYAGVLCMTFVNSWGAWGSPQGIFRYPASWLFDRPLGPQVAWKVVDIRENAPTPPIPQPEGPMLTLVDKIARTVDSAVGKQLWRADGTTPLVKLSSGVLDLASPGRYANAAGITYYGLVISSGGIPQIAWIKVPDCTNVRLVGADPAAAKIAYNEGLTAAQAAVAALPRR